ncbi:transcription termination/antitermination NusG family protein [Pseudomonas fluorescens]|uniref:Transcription antitermination protein RfaH n=1 Tax=Pseudomonas fluorescens TaxID=294 RepID=A0A5E6ZFS2_PSEFL|nr:transcription termination/antitermination NusG family protein [Pseudomonas fluorescens]VVN65342.1 Transcription antitermination protein RfaH [Pseudomonas fluorescens]
MEATICDMCTDMNIHSAASDLNAPREQTWYLIQCKPRQDGRAEEHLIRQGYQCFRPTCCREKSVRGQHQWVTESLFPGYLFINLPNDANWVPLRSTRGVSKVVGFGGKPLPVSDPLIVELQHRSAQASTSTLNVDDKLNVDGSAFSELDVIFMTSDVKKRALLFIDFVSRQQTWRKNGRVAGSIKRRCSHFK